MVSGTRCPSVRVRVYVVVRGAAAPKEPMTYAGVVARCGLAGPSKGLAGHSSGLTGVSGDKLDPLGAKLEALGDQLGPLEGQPGPLEGQLGPLAVSYTHLRAHET